MSSWLFQHWLQGESQPLYVHHQLKWSSTWFPGKHQIHLSYYKRPDPALLILQPSPCSTSPNSGSSLFKYIFCQLMADSARYTGRGFLSKCQTRERRSCWNLLPSFLLVDLEMRGLQTDALDHLVFLFEFRFSDVSIKSKRIIILYFVIFNLHLFSEMATETPRFPRHLHYRERHSVSFSASNFSPWPTSLFGFLCSWRCPFLSSQQVSQLWTTCLVDLSFLGFPFSYCIVKSV